MGGGGSGEGRTIPHSGGSSKSLHATEICTESASGGHLAREDFSLIDFFFPGCEDELEGLTQDWVEVNNCRAGLIRRKQDLEMM